MLRVSSKNLHSKHVIEKLGAVPDDSEDLFLKRVVSAFKDVLGEEAYQKAREEAEKLLIKNQGQALERWFLRQI